MRTSFKKGTRRGWRALGFYALGVTLFALFLYVTEGTSRRGQPSQEGERFESDVGGERSPNEERADRLSYARIGPRDPENVTEDDYEDMWRRRREAAERYWELRRVPAPKNEAKRGVPVARQKIPADLDYFDPVLGPISHVEATASAQGKTVDEYLQDRAKANRKIKRAK